MPKNIYRLPLAVGSFYRNVHFWSAAEAINNVDLNISKHNQLIKELEATNLILESKVNQDFQKYNIPDIEPTYEEKRIICKELIEAAELFSYTMYKKIIQVKLKMGFVFNIFYNSNHTISKYFVIDDATATFNRPQTAPEVVKDLISDFSVTSNNNEIFDETVFGEYSFDQLWTIMKADNRLIDLPTITEDDKYLHKTKKSLSN